VISSIISPTSVGFTVAGPLTGNPATANATPTASYSATASASVALTFTSNNGLTISNATGATTNITGTNFFTGQATLNGGTFNVSGAAFPNNTLVNLNNTTLRIAGPMNGGQNLSIGQSNATIDVSGTFYSVRTINGPGALTVTGSGVDTSTFNAGYDAVVGGTIINNVRLNLGNQSYTYGGNQTLTYSLGNISGSGQVYKDGLGTATITGQNTYTGGTIIQGGTLVAQGLYPLGGFNNTTVGAIQANLGALTFQIDAPNVGSNQTIVPGVTTATPLGYNIQFNNNFTLSVNSLSGGGTNAIQFSNLTLGNMVLSSTFGSNYNLRYVGTTTLGGSAATFSPTVNGTSARSFPAS